MTRSWFPPILLHYYITTRCNCNCLFCDVVDNAASGFAELDQVSDVLRQGRKMGVRFVDFTGGEPLLHPHAPQMLENARRLGYKTTLTTNTLLYPRRSGELRGLVDFLHFSLDAADAENHDRLRGTRCFDAVLASIEIALGLGERPDLLFTVAEDNLDHLARLVEIASSLRLILIVNPVFSHLRHFTLSEKMLIKIEKYRRHPFVYVNTAFHRLRRDGGNQINAPRCRVMDAVMVISPNHEWILPCFHFKQTAQPITDLSSMRESEWFRQHQVRQGRFQECQGCELNCYFDPSFMYKPDRYFVESVTAKLHYCRYKYMASKLKTDVDIQAIFNQARG